MPLVMLAETIFGNCHFLATNRLYVLHMSEMALMLPDGSMIASILLENKSCMAEQAVLYSSRFSTFLAHAASQASFSAGALPRTSRKQNAAS
jgi:hypothetical protein